MWRAILSVVKVLVGVVVALHVAAFGLAYRFVDHDVYGVSCDDGGPGEMCKRPRIFPDADAYAYDGEFAETAAHNHWRMRWLHKSDANAATRGVAARWSHFLARGDADYDLLDALFWPALGGVDLEGEPTIGGWLASNLRDGRNAGRGSRVSLLAALMLGPPPPAFPQWLHGLLQGSLLVDRVQTMLDPAPGRFTAFREVGVRFIAPQPLCARGARVPSPSPVARASSNAGRRPRAHRWSLAARRGRVEAALAAGDVVRAEGERLALAVNALLDSANEVAIAELEVLCRESTLRGDCAAADATSVQHKFLRRMLVTANLRLGEVTNCAERHSAESCHLPLRGRAVHLDRAPARAAMTWLEAERAHDPDSQHAKWLMNIVAQQLDAVAELPDDVRLPESAFASEFDVGFFHNVAGPLGLDQYGVSGSSVADDWFGHGRFDVYQTTYVQWGGGPRPGNPDKTRGFRLWRPVSRSFWDRSGSFSDR